VTHSMPDVVYINLDRAADRRAFMARQGSVLVAFRGRPSDHQKEFPATAGSQTLPFLHKKWLSGAKRNMVCGLNYH